MGIVYAILLQKENGRLNEKPRTRISTPVLGRSRQFRPWYARETGVNKGTLSGITYRQRLPFSFGSVRIYPRRWRSCYYFPLVGPWYRLPDRAARCVLGLRATWKTNSFPDCPAARVVAHGLHGVLCGALGPPFSFAQPCAWMAGGRGRQLYSGLDIVRDILKAGGEGVSSRTQDIHIRR